MEADNDKYKQYRNCLERVIISTEGKWKEVSYYAYQAPMLLLWPRDVLLKSKRRQLNKHQVLVLMQSTTHPMYPVRSDRVRMETIHYTLSE